MTDLNLATKKLTLVRRSCITDAHYTTAKRYSNLYRAELQRQQERWRKRVPKDIVMIMLINIVCILSIGVILLIVWE